MKNDQKKPDEHKSIEKTQVDSVNPETVKPNNNNVQYEIKNDGQAGLTGEASEQQDASKRLRYDGSSLSDGGTWGGVATLLRSPQHGFGL